MNLLNCDGNNIFKEMDNDFHSLRLSLGANDSDDSSDTANKFTDLVTELYLYFSKLRTINTKDTLLPLLEEITRKYKMLESIT